MCGSWKAHIASDCNQIRNGVACLIPNYTETEVTRYSDHVAVHAQAFDQGISQVKCMSVTIFYCSALTPP
ncbi:hypothetical protein E2542_SST07865 [Spatholobus suberectus]|nr:hypothetical protein E2542_SST07865 [Spatholobus suberectus]